MTFEAFELQPDEYEVFHTVRRTEWGMALLCLICAPVVILLVVGESLPILLGGCMIAVLLAYYGIRLLLCGRHDWAAVTNQRVIVCGYNLVFQESLRQCPVQQVKSWRMWESAHSSRKGLAQGELELRLADGKKFSVPQLAEGKNFLEALRRCARQEEET